jgi:uncharacterized protein (DUF305 family)
VNKFESCGIAAPLLLSMLVTGCSPAKPADGSAGDTTSRQQMAGISMPVNFPEGALYTAADVHFMQGMIAHPAQAIYMSRLAASRGASPRLLKFANKIDQLQQAEIRLMQDRLVANKRTAPDTS